MKTDASPASRTRKTPPEQDFDRLCELAAGIFRVMAAPVRLKILHQLCQGEKNVTELLQQVSTTQPNMSQHLNTLYRAGIVGRRRDGAQIFYFIANARVVELCRAVCGEVAAGAQLPHP